MDKILNWLSNSQNLLVIAVLVGGVGYAYEKFSGGRNKAKSESSDETKANTILIDGLKTQISGFERLVESLRTEHKEEIGKMRTENTRQVEAVRLENVRLTGEVGRLQGAKTEQDGKLKEYKEIFQGYNPRIESTLKTIAEFMTALQPVMVKISEHFEVEHPVLNKNI